jgi:DEAD/DEAH box helicase domain-containing protein
VLHCPKCGSKLDIYKGGQIWTVRCFNCNAQVEIGGRNKDLLDAYEAYVQAVNSGTIGGSTGLKPAKTERPRKTLAEDEGTAKRRVHPGGEKKQSHEEIAKAITDGGSNIDELPDALRPLIESGKDYLVSYRYNTATDAEYGCGTDELKIPSRLKTLLHDRGITRLYKFQEQAFKEIQDGKDVVLAAPTGQGKTEAFVLPIVTKLLATTQEAFGNAAIRALLVYPTKALARDQFDKLEQMCAASNLSLGVFDGDVPANQREKLYASPPDILLTNPDVLHYHLGWDQSRLVPLLHSVKYVVLDEIHLYTGSMGANVYYILKRLEMESGKLQVIGASATISNPVEFAAQLFDRPVALIESTSRRRGPFHFFMYYPAARSKYSMIVNLVQMLQRGQYKTLVFGNTHSEAELLNLLLRDAGVKSEIHRAGLSKTHRTRVETDFKSGQLPVLVSTPTLELGIDIGDLDSVVSMIVSITRLTQRIGRAGRKGQESVAILALRENDPISSYYRLKPEKYFTDIDSAYMEPENEVVGRYQLMAAARSGKMNASQFPRQRKIIDSLIAEGILKELTDGQIKMADANRVRRELSSYNVRGIGDTIEIKSGEKTLGERSMPMAAQELHPGAIYLHGGKNYQSVEFKHVRPIGRATVAPLQDRSYYTRPLYMTMPKIMETHEERHMLGLSALYCTLEMTQTVWGFIKKETLSGRVVSKAELPQPLDYRYPTRGFVFSVPEPKHAIDDYTHGKFDALGGPKMDPVELYGGTFHAVEHVIIESSDMLTGGGTREIGGVSMGDSGIIFVYDGSPGGNGASKLLFGRLEEAFHRAETILANCDCKTIDGCPLCTYSYQCGNNNRPLFKLGALESIRQVLNRAETKVDTVGYSTYQPVV